MPEHGTVLASFFLWAITLQGQKWHGFPTGKQIRSFWVSSLIFVIEGVMACAAYPFFKPWHYVVINPAFLKGYVPLCGT